MKFMEDRILRDGQVRPGNILKVDSFLNHQLDISLLNEVGKAFYERFKDKGVTRILTVEASGIAIACMTANYFGTPVIFAKKSKSRNLDGDLYTSVVHSFTYGIDNSSSMISSRTERLLTVFWISADRPALKSSGSASRSRRVSSGAETICASAVMTF